MRAGAFPTVHTFLFADLAGYTALTEAHGDRQAADLVDAFCSAVGELLAEHRAEQVKTIGDALMIRADDAADAVRLALAIDDRIGDQHGFPSVRVGLHTGPAVEREGDWFGVGVNVAARVAGVARADEVLLTEATRRAAGAMEEIELQERGRQRLKNVAEPLALYLAVRTGEETARGLPVDPVCRMAVDPERSAGTLKHAGVEHYFCSMACAEAFASAPGRYSVEIDARGASLSSVVAALQGSSYVGFGLWSLLGRRHYARQHRLERDGWLLDAHGMWLLVVGATLAISGYRENAAGQLRTLGIGAALGLAAVDAFAAATKGVAPVYRADLAWETALALGWAASFGSTHESVDREGQGSSKIGSAPPGLIE